MAKVVQIKGQKILQKALKKMANPQKLFDNDVKQAALKSIRELVKGTLGKGRLRTGNTARGWTIPIKLGPSLYVVHNAIKTQDRKHLIVNILNFGRKEVVPVNSKFLYIPLTNAGASKGLGDAIPDDLVRGIDFVLAKKSAAVDGTGFMEKAEKNAARNLTKLLIKKIRKVHR